MLALSQPRKETESREALVGTVASGRLIFDLHAQVHDLSPYSVTRPRRPLHNTGAILVAAQR